MTKAETKRKNHRQFMRGCLRKVDYLSERSALRAIKAQAVDGVPRHEHYKCKFCSMWHLTHIAEK